MNKNDPPQRISEYIQHFVKQHRQRNYIQTTDGFFALLRLLDVLTPELLKLAGNGLPLQGHRKIWKALNLYDYEDIEPKTPVSEEPSDQTLSDDRKEGQSSTEEKTRLP